MDKKNLIHLDTARRELAEVTDVWKAKRIRDKAEAYRYAAKEAKAGLDIQNKAAEIKIRAERKAGELLAGMAETGERETHGGDRKSKSQAVTLKLDDLDIARMESHRWQTVATIPEKDFEHHIAEAKDAKKELTSAGVYRFARRLEKREPVETPPLPEGKYRCIVIDPPWPMDKIVRNTVPTQGKVLDYPTMTLDEIRELPVADLGDDKGCHLYLWVTHRFLPVALDILPNWGFRYQCLLTWLKPGGFQPFGQWQYNTEHVVFARSGSLALEKPGKLGFAAKRHGHSVKPAEFYELVIAASPEPRLEMFARKPRDGFEVWGNET